MEGGKKNYTLRSPVICILRQTKCEWSSKWRTGWTRNVGHKRSKIPSRSVWRETSEGRITLRNIQGERKGSQSQLKFDNFD